MQYYYLVSLNKLRYYPQYVEEKTQFNLDNLPSEKKDFLTWMTIESLREIGHIDEAYLILKANHKLTTNNIDYLLCKADIFELAQDFTNASKTWKLIIQNFKDDMPSYSWDRYYKTMNLHLSC